MAFDDIMLHDVGGVTDLTFADDGEGWTFTAACGLGRISGACKPTVPFGKGSLPLDSEVNGKTRCDDAQLVAAFVAAFEGYNPFVGDDAAEWAKAHTHPGDRTFSYDEGPRNDFTPRTTEASREYLRLHGVPHPGTPV